MQPKKGYEKHDEYTDLALSYTVTSRESVSTDSNFKRLE
jgi:hypothetical protein